MAGLEGGKFPLGIKDYNFMTAMSFTFLRFLFLTCFSGAASFRYSEMCSLLYTVMMFICAALSMWLLIWQTSERFDRAWHFLLFFGFDLFSYWDKHFMNNARIQFCSSSHLLPFPAVFKHCL